MKYYAAVGDKRELSAVVVMPPVRILFSYHYYKNKIEEIQECVAKNYEVFIDSGAFSADTVGAEIDIDEYCRFIINCGASMYAGLDVIGDAKSTMLNIKYMEETYGLKPLPTFHMGSTLEELKDVALGQYPYICLGGLVFSPGVVAHCDRVWAFILRENPKLKVHGFGLTNLDLMRRYPWHSIDSSSYKSCRRYGRQGILWDGFDFKTIPEKEYWKLLERQGYKNIEGLTNNERYFLYDFHSVQSYKLFAEHLGEVNKHRKFDFLTAQQELF